MRLLSTIIGFQSVCYKHTKSLAAHARLIVKTLNHAELREQLETLHNYCKTLGVLKTGIDTVK
jgi:hypothetical protein